MEVFLLVDIFSKYTQVVPVHGKTTDEILDALITGMHLMGGYPEVVYSDNEACFSSTKINEHDREHKITLVMTLNYAPIAQSQIIIILGHDLQTS